MSYQDQIKNLPSENQHPGLSDASHYYEAGHEACCESASKIAASADARIECLEKALRDLVKCNEDWNTDMQSIIGKPVKWNDSYLDAAREALNHE